MNERINEMKTNLIHEIVVVAHAIVVAIAERVVEASSSSPRPSTGISASLGCHARSASSAGAVEAATSRRGAGGTAATARGAASAIHAGRTCRRDGKGSGLRQYRQSRCCCLDLFVL